MRFYLGTHIPSWLTSANVPLFISQRRLSTRRTFPRAQTPWALDSGGFSELSMFGEWQTTAANYAACVKRYSSEIGRLDWAAVQDWMCEPFILSKTGLSVIEHQRRTIQSYQRLTDIAPEIPWTPVLQGFEAEDYIRHMEMYAQAGVDLTTLPLVGLGSICRRQHTAEAEAIIQQLAHIGIRLHGFGFKLLGLRHVSDLLESADSMAWSFAARHADPLPGHKHQNCANCQQYALEWHQQISTQIKFSQACPQQLHMFTSAQHAGQPA